MDTVNLTSERKKPNTEQIFNLLKITVEEKLTDAQLQYNEEINQHALTKTNLSDAQHKLNEQSVKLDAQKVTIEEQSVKLDVQESRIDQQSVKLDAQKLTIDQQSVKLVAQQNQIDEILTAINEKSIKFEHENTNVVFKMAIASMAFFIVTKIVFHN